MIRRYKLDYFLRQMQFDEEGMYILFTDHLAALEAAGKEKEILRLDNIHLQEIRGEYFKRIASLEAAVKEKDDQIKSMKEHTRCAYCGHEIHIDDEAATKISEHIMSCEKHPLHITFAEIDRLTSANAKQAEEIGRLREAMTETIRRARALHAALKGEKEAEYE